MPWIELELICPSCGAKTVIRLETGDRNPVCSHCEKNILSVNIFHPNGFIYVLSNPSMPGLYKIGYTERDVAERAAELSAATGVPEPYIVEAFFPSEAPATDEAEIHSSLRDFRGTRKEFFRVDLQRALDAIYKVCGRSPRYCRPELHYEIPDERAAREVRERAQQKAEAEAKRAKERKETEQIESELHSSKCEYKNLKTLIELNHLNSYELKKAQHMLAIFPDTHRENLTDLRVWLKECKDFIGSVKDRRIRMKLGWKLD